MIIKTTTKKIKFQSQDMKISSLGAALSGIIKTDLGKLAKDINTHENCIAFPNFILTLKMKITNVIRFTVSTPDTMDLIRSKMLDNISLSMDNIIEIATIKMPSTNTNILNSMIKTVIATAKSANIKVDA